jgi:outer membrane lipoprotein-sorting protein
MIRVGVVALLLTGGVGVGQDLSGEQVLENLLRGMEGVEDYTATLNIVADIEMNLGTLTANFSVDRVDWDTVHGARAYRLTLLPRSERTRTRRVQLLVDPEHWTAERIVTNTVDGRSIAATFRYVQVEDFWLPSHLDVTLASAEQDSSQLPPWEAQPGTSSRRRGPLKGTLEIRYSNYRVNTGLSDDLFHTREEPQDR